MHLTLRYVSLRTWRARELAVTFCCRHVLEFHWCMLIPVKDSHGSIALIYALNKHLYLPLLVNRRHCLRSRALWPFGMCMNGWVGIIACGANVFVNDTPQKGVTWIGGVPVFYYWAQWWRVVKATYVTRKFMEGIPNISYEIKRCPHSVPLGQLFHFPLRHLRPINILRGFSL
jgi:hypothetical protein